MSGTYTKILLHAVFSTKDRRPQITDRIRPRLYQFICGIIKSEKGLCYEIGGKQDHVHMLVRWRPDKSFSSLMRNVKSRSSAWVHQTFPDSRDFRWQDGYAAFSVSESQMKSLKKYIRQQEEHHKERDFKHELVALLKRHRIEFDEEYLWK